MCILSYLELAKPCHAMPCHAMPRLHLHAAPANRSRHHQADAAEVLLVQLVLLVDAAGDGVHDVVEEVVVQLAVAAAKLLLLEEERAGFIIRRRSALSKKYLSLRYVAHFACFRRTKKFSVHEVFFHFCSMFFFFLFALFR